MKEIRVYICPHCGSEERILDWYCSSCGKKIGHRAPPVKPTGRRETITTKVCPKCGKESEGKFCPKDGTLIIEIDEEVNISFG